MKTIYIQFILLLALAQTGMYAQTYQDEQFELNTNLSTGATEDKTYEARDNIKLKPGFDFSTSGGHKFIGR